MIYLEVEEALEVAEYGDRLVADVAPQGDLEAPKDDETRSF